jgi:hypothetical protein
MTKLLNAADHPLLSHVYMPDHQVFKDELKEAETLYEVEFSGYKLSFSNRQGEPALFIENKTLGELSTIIILGGGCD